MVAGPAYLTLLSRYDPAARGLFDRVTAEQGGPRRGIISRAFKKLRYAQILSRIDALWIMAGADSQIARLNWLSSAFTLTPVNSPTFTADRGYTGDAVSAYLNTGFTPSTDGVKYQKDDMSVGLYARNAGSTGVWLGAQATPGTRWTQIQDGAADMSYRANAGTNSVATGVGGVGLHVSERVSSTSIRYVKNGVPSPAVTLASEDPPDRPIFILCRNRATMASPDPGNYTNAQFSAAWIGGALTDAQHVALKAILDEYLAAVGAI